MRLLLTCGFLFLTHAAPAVQEIGLWKSYTSKREVRDVAIAGNVVWSATSGGLFSLHLTDGSLSEFTTSEGLRVTDLTAVTIDSAGVVWSGSSNGILHGYDPAAKAWRYVMDIHRLDAPQKRINALQLRGDTLLILSDIGVSVFLLSRMQFGDTYMRFGTGVEQISGGARRLEFYRDSLWVATAGGVAATSLSNPNPSSPDSWKLYTATHGLPSRNVGTVVAVGDSLVATTDSGLAVYGNGRWRLRAPTAGMSILDAAISGDDPQVLFFVTSAALWSFTPGSSPVQLSSHVTALTSVADGTVLGTAREGLLLGESGTSWRSYIPPGPASNRFIGIAVDNDGAVWSGTGTAAGEGIMAFDGTSWKSIRARGDARLGTDNFFKISIGVNNAKWAGNWGAGIALFDDRGILQRVLNSSAGIPGSVENDPAFVVMGGVAVDRGGTTWLTPRTPPPDTALMLFTPDSAIVPVEGRNLRASDFVINDVLIDFNGTKWFTNFTRFEPSPGKGLLFYNEHFAMPRSVDGWGVMSTSDNLTSNQIWSLALGHDGELWVGSDQGISIIFNPRNPFVSTASYHPLRDQLIQSILVDPLNNKWLATRQGVFVLSPDGTSILVRYTVENTQGKLLADDVTSIAMDEDRGIVYFGTEKGLSSLTTSALIPRRAFEELLLTPNPFVLPSDRMLTIDGLVQNSGVKILSSDGSLVRDLTTPGGRIGFWDGKNGEGELVGSGVFIVVAYSEDGTKVGTGKLAVVRR